METPKRRSTRNLSHLSIAPLSSAYDTQPDSYFQLPSNDNHSGGQWTAHSSYIAGKSAPATPGILGRSPSGTRLSGAKSFAHLAFTTDRNTGDIFDDENGKRLAKSKSTTLLHPPGHVGPQNHGLGRRRKLKSIGAGGIAGNVPARALPRSIEDGEWLYRAGALISNEARESKGQSWLVSRESSTSLAAMVSDDEEDNLCKDSRAFSSKHVSRNPSRNASRTASTRTSRRPSGVGSRSDLNFFTPTLTRTPGRNMSGSAHSDYFGQVESRDSSAVAMGPDFVDDHDNEEDDEDIDIELRQRLEEAEVARLANDRGFGLGGLVDRLVGWTLFEVKEDEGHETQEDVNDEKQQQLRKTKSAPAREQTGHIARDGIMDAGTD